MKTMTQHELNVALEKHKAFLAGDPNGKKANFGHYDLSGLDFVNIDLAGVDFSNANLRAALFERCNLSGADFTAANLRNAGFIGCAIINANFHQTYLRSASFNRSDMKGAWFWGADCYNADFYDAQNMDTIHINEDTEYMFLRCPSEGSFIGWKKARCIVDGFRRQCIIKLEIPADALRSSATTRKCRCSKAKILDIVTMGENPYM